MKIHHSMSQRRADIVDQLRMPLGDVPMAVEFHLWNKDLSRGEGLQVMDLSYCLEVPS